MLIVEPCCYRKQIGEIIDRCTQHPTLKSTHFFSYSDWDVVQLLDTLAGYAGGGVIGIVMVRLDVPLIAAIRRILSGERVDNTCSHTLPNVERMILVTQPGQNGDAINQREEVRAQLGKFIDCGQLVVCEDNVGFRCLAIGGQEHSLVVQGSINPVRSNAMQMFTLTASNREYQEVMEMLEGKARTKNVFKR